MSLCKFKVNLLTLTNAYCIKNNNMDDLMETFTFYCIIETYFEAVSYQ